MRPGVSLTAGYYLVIYGTLLHAERSPRSAQQPYVRMVRAWSARQPGAPAFYVQYVIILVIVTLDKSLCQMPKYRMEIEHLPTQHIAMKTNSVRIK